MRTIIHTREGAPHRRSDSREGSTYNREGRKMKRYIWEGVTELKVVGTYKNHPLHDKVVFEQEVDLYPHSIIKKGETGRIISPLHDDVVLIKLDKEHTGLDTWDNCLQITPGDEYLDRPGIYTILNSKENNTTKTTTR